MKNCKCIHIARSLLIFITMISTSQQVISAESRFQWNASLDVGNRYLFRSQAMGDDAPTIQLELMGKTTAGQMIGGSFRGIRGPTSADTVSHLFAGQEFRFAGFDLSMLAEYMNWHHSDFRTMTPIGFSVQKDWFRVLIKQDLAEGGGQHLELNLRALKRNRSLVVVSVVDTLSPQKDIVTVTSTLDPDDITTPIITRTSSVEETALQYVALHGNFDINQELRLYGIFYHHLKDQNDSSTWQLGLRWLFFL